MLKVKLEFNYTKTNFPNCVASPLELFAYDPNIKAHRGINNLKRTEEKCWFNAVGQYITEKGCVSSLGVNPEFIPNQRGWCSRLLGWLQKKKTMRILLGLI